MVLNSAEIPSKLCKPRRGDRPRFAKLLGAKERVQKVLAEYFSDYFQLKCKCFDFEVTKN